MEKKHITDRLNSLLEKADGFEYAEMYKSGGDFAKRSEFEAWIKKSADTLERLFPAGSAPSDLANKAESASRNIPRGRGEGAFRSCLETMKQALKEGLTEIEDEFYTHAGGRDEEDGIVQTNKVFLVHGHQGELKEQVARFVRKIGLEPVILHEQATGGSTTIIEKIEEYSGVAYALVLLTPDDVGAEISVLDGPEDEIADKLNSRARQNVVLELGYFIAKLGRDRVTALHEGDIELPSDYSGVIYTPTDENKNWKLKIGRELKEAGLEIDMNQAL